jgi:hypothetical protein
MARRLAVHRQGIEGSLLIAFLAPEECEQCPELLSVKTILSALPRESSQFSHKHWTGSRIIASTYGG